MIDTVDLFEGGEGEAGNSFKNGGDVESNNLKVRRCGSALMPLARGVQGVS